MPETICLLGHHEPDYPRNRSVRSALETAGFRVHECHSRAPFPWRHFILALRLLRAPRDAGWVFVTEGGHRLVPWVKGLARLTGRKVAFDPFLSRYNTRIEDRRLYGRRSLQALICLWQDWSSTHAADFLFFDTGEHRDYFARKYRLRKPSAILPVGVDESVFAPRDPAGSPMPEAFSGAGFRVLFYGTCIPLQGAEWIVEAASLLAEEDVRFVLIGRGQTYGMVRERAASLRTVNIAFVDPVAPERLSAYLAHADVCLGIFGDSLKAGNVVPNKVVQAAAAAKPIVTRESSAVRAYFRGGQDALLVPPASPPAIADAIRRLKADPALRRALGARARAVFERDFSTASLAGVLRGALSRDKSDNGSGHGSGPTAGREPA